MTCDDRTLHLSQEQRFQNVVVNFEENVRANSVGLRKAIDQGCADEKRFSFDNEFAC